MTTIQTDAFPCISPYFLSAVISQCLKWDGDRTGPWCLGCSQGVLQTGALNEGVWKKWEDASPVAPHQLVVLSWAPAVQSWRDGTRPQGLS